MYFSAQALLLFLLCAARHVRVIWQSDCSQTLTVMYT